MSAPPPPEAPQDGAHEGAPEGALSSPALLFLYYRVEQVLGIKATSDALARMNAQIEKSCGATFVENPRAYESVFASREQVFEISKTVTVNETYFFREGAHFELLARHLLQGLAKPGRPLRVCSAATSIGCEAYSIAMLLDHAAKNGPRFDFEVDAFDISAEVIEMAKIGRYTSNALRADGSAWKHVMDQYLEKDGEEYVVSPGLRGKVRFFTHNIMRGLGRQYDVIFFRNAMIYFSSKNRLFILNDFAESLAGDGLLFLGVSETYSAKHPLLASRCMSETFYFQKTTDAESPPGGATPAWGTPLYGARFEGKEPASPAREQERAQKAAGKLGAPLHAARKLAGIAVGEVLEPDPLECFQGDAACGLPVGAACPGPEHDVLGDREPGHERGLLEDHQAFW